MPDQRSGADKSRLQSTRQRAELWRGQGNPATRGYRCRWDAEAGVPYSTAGKSVVWNEGRRLLVSKDTEGKLMTIESRRSEVRRLWLAVKPTTQQGQWVCSGPDRAFAHKLETGKVIPFERARPTDGASQLNFMHENDANSKLQEVMEHDDGTAFGTDGESRTHEGTASCNQTNVDWTKDVSSLQPFGWRSADP